MIKPKRENLLQSMSIDLMEPGCITNGSEILFLNEKFLQITGYNELQIRKKFFSSLFSKPDHEDLDIKLLIKNLKSEFLYLQTSKNNHLPVILNFLKININENSILITLTDLSEVGAKIFPELNHYNLFENSPMGIIIFDNNLNIIRMNQTVRKIFGINKKQINIKLNEFIPLQTYDITLEKLQKSLRKKLPEENIINCMKAKEEVLFCKWYMVPDNDSKGLIAYINDITAIKTTEHNLFKEKTKVEAANQKLKQAIKEARKLASEVTYANNSKSTFIANISHEIRTPLNAIMGFSEILAKEIKNPQQAGFLQSIIQSGRSLLEIINSILNYSKLEAGKRKIEKTEIHLKRFLEQSINVYKERCQQKNIKFVLSQKKNLPSYIELDKQLLNQIIRNLLDNAIKFTSEGSVELSVNCIYHDEDFVSMEIEVKDTGIGIPKDQQEKIFSPFSQKDDQVHATYGGTGLGLSIVQKSVSLLSGTMSMKSIEGKGTTFKINLPHIATINREDEIAKILLENIDISRIYFENKNILIADKTSFTRLLIKNFLDQYSFNIFESISFDDMDSTLSSHDIDMIIISESQVSNKKIMEYLKKLIETSNITIIIYGSSQTDLINNLIDNNNCKYIKKPIKQEMLIKTMASLIEYKTTESQKDNVKKSIVPQNMPKDRIERMVNFLTIEFLPKCEKLQENLMMNQIEELCEEVAIVGEENNVWILINWTKELNSAIENFEIIKIKQLLRSFSSIIKEISSIIK